MVERDYDIEVGAVTAMDLFNRRLADKSSKYAKLHNLIEKELRDMIKKIKGEGK